MSEKKNKEILNIVVANNTKPKEYLDYLGIYYDVNVIESDKVTDSKQVDLILFTGGADVDPAQYGQTTGKYTGIDVNRDALEIDIFYRFKSKPKLGICRGSQLLTVLAGGSLIQHVEGHTKEHLVYINHYGRCSMPSTHHQMMYPFNLSKERYILHGWSDKFQSSTYLDGNNNEIETSKDFLEPEIVEYPQIKALCIQGHPEIGNNETKEITLELFSNFFNKLKPQLFKYNSKNESSKKTREVDDEEKGDWYDNSLDVNKKASPFGRYVINHGGYTQNVDLDIKNKIETSGSGENHQNSKTDIDSSLERLKHDWSNSVKASLQNLESGSIPSYLDMISKSNTNVKKVLGNLKSEEPSSEDEWI